VPVDLTDVMSATQRPISVAAFTENAPPPGGRPRPPGACATRTTRSHRTRWATAPARATPAHRDQWAGTFADRTGSAAALGRTSRARPSAVLRPHHVRPALLRHHPLTHTQPARRRPLRLERTPAPPPHPQLINSGAAMCGDAGGRRLDAALALVVICVGGDGASPRGARQGFSARNLRVAHEIAGHGERRQARRNS
jgi:hypothetical protein